MGSLLGVWFTGRSIPLLRPNLGVARWFHIPVVLGLGVFIGSYFKGDLIGRTITYAPTVIAMVIVTIIVTATSFFLQVSENMTASRPFYALSLVRYWRSDGA